MAWALSIGAVGIDTVSLAVLSIPARSIDHERARGLRDSNNKTDHEQPVSWRVILERRSLVVLAAANAVFHFANAPMLPLLSQKLALAHPGVETALTSACIITAQLISIGTRALRVIERMQLAGYVAVSRSAARQAP